MPGRPRPLPASSMRQDCLPLLFQPKPSPTSKPMTKEHHYSAEIRWTGNLGKGTSGYRDYDRDHVISVMGKPEIPASSDPSFRGNNTRYNPEEMLVASLSSCHMLWYLHLCSEAGVVVTTYSDHATGVMEEEGNAGAFASVTLHPVVTVL